jgi:hypothetical protein
MFTLLRKPIVLTALVLAAAALTTPASADKEAADLLTAATSMRETWPKSFPGFTAKIHVEQDSKTADGTVTVAADGKVDVTLEDSDLNKMVTSTLRSLVLHRMAGDSGHENPSLGPTDNSPQGRAILLNDDANSLYRIRDNQIMQVNRTMGPIRFTIDILRNRLVEGGKYLPAFFTVTYRDAKTGALHRTETFEESYTRVGGMYLPSGRRAVSATPTATSITTIALTDLHLLATTTSLAK